jgi:hypothetical protein
MIMASKEIELKVIEERCRMYKKSEKSSFDDVAKVTEELDKEFILAFLIQEKLFKFKE